MTEKKPDYNTAIVIGSDRRLSASRSKMISRGLEIAVSLEKTVLTIIRDIIVDIAINGALKKQSIIDPVKMKGEQISQVSLGPVLNEKELPSKEIERHDFRIGDIISLKDPLESFPTNPRLLLSIKVVMEKRTGNEKVFTIPDKCPACGSKLKIHRPPDLPAYYCTGTGCPGRTRAQLIAFCHQMDIELAPELAKELVEKRMVSDSADLYFLKKWDLMRLDKMDEDLAQTFLNAIEKSRHPTLYDIIYALLVIGGFLRSGIILDVASRCNSINDLFDADKVSRIKSMWIKPNYVIGNTLALRIQNFMNEEVTLNFLEKLRKGGVVFPTKGND